MLKRAESEFDNYVFVHPGVTLDALGRLKEAHRAIRNLKDKKDIQPLASGHGLRDKRIASTSFVFFREASISQHWRSGKHQD